MTDLARNLTSKRIVRELSPIPGADFIEMATVDGWKCIVKKGEFKVGDTGIYFEIDSFLPAEDPRFLFLKNDFVMYNNKAGARIKTKKLRGVVSQGLLMPLSLFPELAEAELNQDLSEKVGVIKYDPEEPVHPDAIREFPAILQKTDQKRIQNITDFIENYLDVIFEVTQKLDGTSMTVYYNRGDFGVCSKNLEMKRNAQNMYWEMADKHYLEMAMSEMGANIAVQGEMIGEGIRTLYGINYEEIKGRDFYVFNIWDISNSRYLGAEERRETILRLNKNIQAGGGAVLKSVPVITTARLRDLITDKDTLLDDLLRLAASGKNLSGNKCREGLVFKSIDGRFSFKIISNQYLLNEEKLQKKNPNKP